jgi:hypothetical protein
LGRPRDHAPGRRGDHGCDLAYAETRRQARDWVEPVGTFVEVFVKAVGDECARRDVKGAL